MSDEKFPTLAVAEWAVVWRQTRSLTYDLLRALPYPIMNFSPHPDFGTLIRQMRHVAEIQACYIAALHTGKMDFAVQPKQRALEQSKDQLEAYMRHLDDQLGHDLQALPDASMTRLIEWGNDRLTLLQHLMGLVQHESLHHGMWSFYAKIADLPLPESWRHTWGLT